MPFYSLGWFGSLGAPGVREFLLKTLSDMDDNVEVASLIQTLKSSGWANSTYSLNLEWYVISL